MPKARTLTGRSEMYKSLYVDGTLTVGETNDCSVKACAVVGGVPYAVALAGLTALGRQPRRGVSTTMILDYVRSTGKTVRRVDQQELISLYPGAHKNLQNITSHHPERFNKVWANGKTYLLFTEGHVLAVANGVNHDHSVGRSFRAYMIYEVMGGEK